MMEGQGTSRNANVRYVMIIKIINLLFVFKQLYGLFKVKHYHLMVPTHIFTSPNSTLILQTIIPIVTNIEITSK